MICVMQHMPVQPSDPHPYYPNILYIVGSEYIVCWGHNCEWNDEAIGHLDNTRHIHNGVIQCREFNQHTQACAILQLGEINNECELTDSRPITNWQHGN